MAWYYLQLPHLFSATEYSTCIGVISGLCRLDLEVLSFHTSLDWSTIVWKFYSLCLGRYRVLSGYFLSQRVVVAPHLLHSLHQSSPCWLPKLLHLGNKGRRGRGGRGKKEVEHVYTCTHSIPISPTTDWVCRLMGNEGINAVLGINPLVTNLNP